MEVHVIQPEAQRRKFSAQRRVRICCTRLWSCSSPIGAPGSAATKSKGFVRGGGKKPWRQKGTGRARAGSIRSPIFVGGGTAFGPQPRDYSYRMPRTARREALLSALSLKRRDGKIVVVDKFALEAPKTKLMVKALAELNVESALIVISQADSKIERSARNLPKGQGASCRGVECLRSAPL